MISVVMFFISLPTLLCVKGIHLVSHSLEGVYSVYRPCLYSVPGWESQLLETGFLAIFLCPILSLRQLPRHTPTSWAVVWGYRWLIFRIMLGAVRKHSLLMSVHNFVMFCVGRIGLKCGLDTKAVHYSVVCRPASKHSVFKSICDFIL